MGFKFDRIKPLLKGDYNTSTAPLNPGKNDSGSGWSSSSCFIGCRKCKCQGDLDFPPPLPLAPPAGDGSHAKQLVTMGMIVMSCIIAGTLLFGILCAAVRVYRSRRNNSRRTNPPIIFATQEDFFDEDHGPVLDHPIWYINTIGLPQSVIDSIAVFKYKKDVGLIEGTDCSVCLSEFQEDESLRLLPKCSHAFHISCIDTWLRSHTNCPLCRAPILSGAFVAQASESEPNSNDSNSRNEIMVVNSENSSGEGSDNVGGGTGEVRNGNDNNNGSLPVEDERTVDDSMKILPHLKTRNCDSGCRVLSDLAENRRVVEEDTQPMRRSVSLDSSAASMIYNAVTEGVVHVKHQGNMDAQLGKSKSSKSKIVFKRGSGGSSPSICRLVKSSSIGSSLQKGPMLMKRSLSSIGKLPSSRHSRRYSALPL
ncbi:hypothetical protein AB3S75_001719 [Citrus x aurantiifolia]